MIYAFLAVCLVQDPTPPAQVPPAPVPAPVKQEKPPLSREDRLQGRIAVDPAPQPEPEAPVVDPKPPEVSHPGTKFNSAALIVNEEPVTMLELQRGVVRAIRDRKGGDPDVVFGEVIEARAKELLEIQAGKDLGFEPAAVDRIVRNWMERQAEAAGSVTQLAAELKQDDMNSFDRKDEISSFVHRRLWEESVTGISPSPGGRLSRDAYVRPGFAMFIQRVAAREQPANRRVQVTNMILTPEGPSGGMERAKKRLEDLRQRVENGEDMGALAEQFRACEPGTRGLTDFKNIEGLRGENPAVAAFLDTAQVGELSPALDFYYGGKLVGYIVVRAEEFKSTPIESFDDPRGQRTWIEGHRERIKKMRIDAGLMELLGAAYVWPPQVFRATAKK